VTERPTIRPNADPRNDNWLHGPGWTYYKRLALDPERVTAVYRIDGPSAEVYAAGEWLPVPGESLKPDQDHLLEQIDRHEAELLVR
jgi:hypothetical protein